VKICQGCEKPFQPKKHDYARWCSKRCFDFHRHWPERRQRILAAIERRPRCIICDAPIRYGEPGVRYSATTCGDTDCARKRWRWYGPNNRTDRRNRQMAKLLEWKAAS